MQLGGGGGRVKAWRTRVELNLLVVERKESIYPMSTQRFRLSMTVHVSLYPLFKLRLTHHFILDSVNLRVGDIALDTTFV